MGRGKGNFSLISSFCVQDQVLEKIILPSAHKTRKCENSLSSAHKMRKYENFLPSALTIPASKISLPAAPELYQRRLFYIFLHLALMFVLRMAFVTLPIRTNQLTSNLG